MPGASTKPEIITKLQAFLDDTIQALNDLQIPNPNLDPQPEAYNISTKDDLLKHLKASKQKLERASLKDQMTFWHLKLISHEAKKEIKIKLNKQELSRAKAASKIALENKETKKNITIFYGGASFLFSLILTILAAIRFGKNVSSSTSSEIPAEVFAAAIEFFGNLSSGGYNGSSSLNNTVFTQNGEVIANGTLSLSNSAASSSNSTIDAGFIFGLALVGGAISLIAFYILI